MWREDILRLCGKLETAKVRHHDCWNAMDKSEQTNIMFVKKKADTALRDGVICLSWHHVLLSVSVP